MLGKAYLDIFLFELSEIAVGKFMDEHVHVRPGFVLIVFQVDLLVDLDREKITAGKLRIAGITLRPLMQRFVGKAEFVDQIRIGRVCAGADEIVVEFVVDAEIAHLHAAEIFVTGCRMDELLALIVLEFAGLARASVLGRGRTFWGRRRCGVRAAEDRGAESKGNANGENRTLHVRLYLLGCVVSWGPIRSTQRCSHGECHRAVS